MGIKIGTKEVSLSFIREIQEAELDVQFKNRAKVQNMELNREYNSQLKYLEDRIITSCERMRLLDELIQNYAENQNVGSAEDISNKLTK